MGSFLLLSTTIGVVVSFTLGAFCNYNVIPISGIVIGIIFMIWMTFLPETPLYLCSKEELKAAEKSSEFYSYELKLKGLLDFKNRNELKTNKITFKEISE